MINLISTYLKIFGVHGLFFAVKGKTFGSTKILKIIRKDIKFPIYLRVPSSDALAYEQIFINQEYNFKANSYPRVIVDAGANIGLTSIYFANKYPESKIIAIEAEQSNFLILKKNVESYANIIPIHAALWNTNKTINLFDPGFGEWGFRITEESFSEKSSKKMLHEVQAMTVDKIMEDYDLEKINILKIDIEGAEQEVFKDSSSWIEKIDALIVELHEHLKPGCNDSFYSGAVGFDNQWQRGENIYLTKKQCLIEAEETV